VRELLKPCPGTSKSTPPLISPPLIPSNPTSSSALDDLGLFQQPIGALSKAPVPWDLPIRSHWRADEAEALSLLETFLAASGGLASYEAKRGLADGQAVSRLSPYLHSGQLSPRLVWQRLREVK
jgi:deoxyribodipyrimidine photo-lyase